MESNFVKFNCRECNQVIEAPAEMLGSNVECPTCWKTIPVLPANRVWTTAKKVSKSIFAVFGIACVLFVLYIAYSLVTYKHDQAKPRETKTPITGGFGFWLGDKLPPQYELKNGFATFDISDAAPITSVMLECLNDRTIYMIIGYAYSNSDTVVDAARAKYGFGSYESTKSGSRHRWVNGDNELMVETFGGDCTHVTYTSTSGVEHAVSDDEKAAKSAAQSLSPKL